MKAKIYLTSPVLETVPCIEYVALSYSGTRILYGYAYNERRELIAYNFDNTYGTIHDCFQPTGSLDTELQRDRVLFSNAKTTKVKKKIMKLLMMRELLK